MMWINSRSFCGGRDEADISLMTKVGCVGDKCFTWIGD